VRTGSSFIGPEWMTGLAGRFGDDHHIVIFVQHLQGERRIGRGRSPQIILGILRNGHGLARRKGRSLFAEPTVNADLARGNQAQDGATRKARVVCNKTIKPWGSVRGFYGKKARRHG